MCNTAIAYTGLVLYYVQQDYHDDVGDITLYAMD